jgi:tRNA pseudouridine65 synthase
MSEAEEADFLWSSSYLLPILHEDEDCVAIDKPPGLLVHPTELDAGERFSALGMLREQLGSEVFPVHRLDKATSGVLLFARNRMAAVELGRQFEEGSVGKSYRALVRGWMQEDEGLLDYPLLREEAGRHSRRARVVQEAVTRWSCLGRGQWDRPIGRYPSARYSWLALQPLTGRRHQLRRHMAHLRHPIVGDVRHGDGAHNRAFRAFFGRSRLMLHAARLDFRLPGSDRRLELCAAIPPDCGEVLETLGIRPLEAPL